MGEAGRAGGERRPWPLVTISVGLLAVGVYLLYAVIEPGAGERYVEHFAFHPERLFGGSADDVQGQTLPALVAVFTAMLLHSGLTHLVVNLVCLLSFGLALERALGSARYVVLFLAAGLAAALLHAVATPRPWIPMVGASGAIAGVLAAYVVIWPKRRGYVMPLPIPLPMYLLMGLLLAAHLVFVALDLLPGIAWWAHIGGFVAGAGLCVALRPPHLRLLQGWR